MWKKVVAPVLLVVVLWITLSSTTTFYINWLYESHTQVLQENLSSIQIIGAAQATLWRLQTTVMRAIERPKKNTLAEIPILEKVFEEHLAEAEETAFTVKEQDLIGTIRRKFLAYQKYIQHLLETKPPVGAEDAGEVEKTMLLAQEVAEPCKEFLELNEQLIREKTAQSSRLSASFIVIRWIALVAGPAIGILFGVWMARGLHRSLTKISVTLRGATNELEEEVGHVDVIPASNLPDLQQHVDVIAASVKQVIEQLHVTRQEALRAERLAAVGQLAAGVAHELRNPLTSVKLLIQTTAQRFPSRPLDERQIMVIREEISRMERTIQGLLEFARPAPLHRLRHDLRDTVSRAVHLVEGRARQQHVIIREDLPGGPVWIDGDPELLHQVFVNLLLNGIDSMDDEGELRVVLRIPRGSPRLCRLDFYDSGAGIPEALLERIFEPFVTTKERGTGLGLPISRRIVQEHRGQLVAANQDGRGAVFTVMLPLCPPESEAAPAANTADAPPNRGRKAEGRP
jgi:two-component system sensor histidine kinase HydH